jgi:ketosteroid isomerase-like protein
MSQENVEIVEAALAAYIRDDEGTVRRLTSPDIVVSTRPDQPDARDHHGYDGLLRTSAEWLEAWDEHSFDAARVWGEGEFVFVATRESARGRMSGIPMETESTFLCTLRQGAIVRIQIFGSVREAREAAGLAA